MKLKQVRIEKETQEMFGRGLIVWVQKKGQISTQGFYNKMIQLGIRVLIDDRTTKTTIRKAKHKRG